MKGIGFHRRITRRLRALAYTVCCYLLTFSGAVAGAPIENILILKSNDNRFFNTSIEHLINQTRSQVKFNIENVENLDANPPSFERAELIITLGIKAAEYLEYSTKDIPVIHSYITEFQYRQHASHPHHYAVLLDQPPQRYLAFIDALLGSGKIAILSTENSRLPDSALEPADTRTSGRVQQQLYASKDNLINAIRDLLMDNDVLLSLPDPQIYNQQSLKGILLTSYRQNKPVISYSPAHVKSGALAAIYASPQQIGDQVAGLVNKFLTDPDYRPEASYYASDFTITINQRVANSLQLDIPDIETLQKNLKKGLSQ